MNRIRIFGIGLLLFLIQRITCWINRNDLLLRWHNDIQLDEGHLDLRVYGAYERDAVSLLRGLSNLRMHYRSEQRKWWCDEPIVH